MPDGNHLRCGVTILLLMLVGGGGAARAVTADDNARQRFEARFLKFCDLATAELAKELTPFTSRTNADPATHHMPFFEDAHAVRALAVAYDMTGKRAYLDACCHWSDRIIEYQGRMIPKGAYYINHSRAPGQDKGQWNLADSGSIGLGVLATATRCKDPAAKERYLASVRAFAKLAMDNYVGPDGGICNGLWPEYAGQWWCSSATFGTMAFVLYEETGEEKYLKVAQRAMDWLLGQDFRELKPITFQQRPSGTIFYCFEFYLAGLKHLPPDSPQYQALQHQLDAALDWMAKNRMNNYRIAARPSFASEFDKRGMTPQQGGGHSVPLMLPKEFFASKPELFRMDQTGKRVPDGNVCVSNPETVKLCADVVMKWFRDHPESEYFTVMGWLSPSWHAL